MGAATRPPVCALAHRRRRVEADEHADDEIGRVADEPGVLLLVGRAGLAGDRPPERLQRGRGAALDDALEDRGHLVGGVRIEDLRAAVDELGLLLPGPGVGLAGLARGLVVAPDGLAPAVLDAVDEGRAHLAPAVGDHAVARRQAQKRRLAGAERHGEHRQQVVIDAEAARVLGDERHAEVLGEPHRHLVARLLDAEAQRRGAGRVLLLVVLGLPDVLARSLLDLDRRVEHDRGRLVAVVDGGGVDEGLERGARLAAAPGWRGRTGSWRRRTRPRRRARGPCWGRAR